MTWTKKIVCMLLVFAVSGEAVRAQVVEEDTIEAAGEVLREIMDIPAKAIPQSLLADAHAVAIIPGMIKGGFVVGVRHGKGVVVPRDASGAWGAPVFVTVTGGSVGWQAGLQATDVIVVFRNRNGVDGMLRGKLTLGVDATIAAGPVGRDAAAATDGQLKAEILSYSRSRGLFAGVSIDGAAMLVNHKANAAYYAPRAGQPKDSVPAGAIRLVEQIAAYAGPKHKAAVNVREVPMIDEVESVRAHLAESSLRLHKILDPQWKEFLALPREVYTEGKAPPKEAFEKCASRYAFVTNDAHYQNLTARPEFRETHALLLRYSNALAGHTPGTLKLPAPPN